MEECHKLVIGIVKNLSIDIIPFQTNNNIEIKKQLKSLTKQIDSIIKHKYVSVDIIKKNILSISNKISEFMTIMDLYLFNQFCKQNGHLFGSILQEYLCKNNGLNLDLLYHFTTNFGIILSGCIYMYIDKEPEYISLDIFMNNLSNPQFRFSKTKIKECIKNYQGEKQSLVLARILLLQSINLRKSITKFCPRMIKKQSKFDIDKHTHFEQKLIDIVIELNKTLNMK
jgi:hypothetical protein